VKSWLSFCCGERQSRPANAASVSRATQSYPVPQAPARFATTDRNPQRLKFSACRSIAQETTKCWLLLCRNCVVGHYPNNFYRVSNTYVTATHFIAPCQRQR